MVILLEIIEFLGAFLKTETPFMLMFVALFFYNVKNNNDREKRMSQIIENRLTNMEEELKVLIKVWQILLEKELEDKK
jgi:hypothetical protein